MTPLPPLSVIMTVRNGARYLPETLDALAAQTLRDYELVINDNGSTDDTPAILAAYAARDPRIRLIGIPPGQPSTFTSGIARALAAARAPLVAVNDGDDVPVPARLERQLAVLRADPAVALVASGYDHIDAESRHLGTFRVPDTHAGVVDALQHRGVISHSSVMYRRELALAAGGYRERMTFASDTALWVAMVGLGGRIAVIPEPLIRMRQHEAQTSLMPGRQAQRHLEPLEIFGAAGRLPGASWRARVEGMVTRQKLALRYGAALWHSGQRVRALGATAWWLADALVPPLRWAPGALRDAVRGDRSAGRR